MPNYANLAATAKRLIEANGRSVTLRKRDRAPANASQPWRGPDDVPTPPDGASVTVLAAIVPASGSGLGRGRVVDGSLADTFAMVALVAASSLPSGTNLEEFGTLVDGTQAWSIELVELLQPSDVPLVYSLGLAR